MTVSIVRRLLLTGALLAVPFVAYAQEAVLTGTVADSTGGVLPGVTVTAVHDATGNRFETVTDARRAARIQADVLKKSFGAFGSFGSFAVVSGYNPSSTTTRGFACASDRIGAGLFDTAVRGSQG